MIDIDSKLRASLNLRADGSYNFDIKKSHTQIALIFSDDTMFGVLNDHASKALENLVQQYNLQIEAIGSIQLIREILGRVTKASDAVIHVNLNIYGPKQSSLEVGSHLARLNLYLQRPDVLKVGSTYKNPHTLAFPDFQISNFDNQFEVGKNRAPNLDDARRFEETISNVYSSLTRGTNLTKVGGDRRLKRTLLS